MIDPTVRRAACPLPGGLYPLVNFGKEVIKMKIDLSDYDCCVVYNAISRTINRLNALEKVNTDSAIAADYAEEKDDFENVLAIFERALRS